MFRNFAIVCLTLGVLLLVDVPDSTIAQGENILDITVKARFFIHVIRNRKPVVAFFYSSSECEVCKTSLIPLLEKAVSKSDNIILAKIDLDKVDLRDQQEISTVPTTKVYYKGQPVLHPVEGASRGAMVKLVNDAIKLQPQ